jgi:uncharacterized repeat protein (TIGR02543 family)
MSWVRKSCALALMTLLVTFFTAPGANAVPLAPGFESVTLALITDNDFAAYMGDDRNATRLFWENNVSWPDQIASMSSQDVIPQIGETYIYVVAMGGDPYNGVAGGPGTGGQEDWAGTINRKSLLNYPGAQVAVGRSSVDARDIKLDGYLLMNNYFPNWATSQGDIAGGTYSTDSESVRSALTNVIWAPATLENHPDIANPRTDCTVSCSVGSDGFINMGWDFPDGSAVVFRYPLSAAELPVSAGNSQVIVDWKLPLGGDAPVDYLIDYKESSESDSAYKSFSVVAHPTTIETVTGLTNGTPYTFRVAGRNADGISPYSVSRSVTPVGPPSRPLNLSYTALDRAIAIKFTIPENNGGFGISNYEYSTNNGSTWTSLAPPSVADSITVTGLTNSTEYQVKIRAVTPFGSGAASTALSATPGVTVYRSVSYLSGTLDSITSLPSGGTYTEGDTFLVAEAPTRANFTFMAWSDGQNNYQPNDIYTVAAGNVNLTAQWRQASLVGTTNADIAKVLTWNILGSEAIDATVSSDSGLSSVRVEIPSNTFDPGTEVIFWRLTNQNAAKSAINSAYDFMVNLAVSWSIGDDVTSAKRVLIARNPVLITITNATIEKDATAWMIIGGVATKIGTATEAGEIRVAITEDPIITAANVSIAYSFPASQVMSPEAQRRARDEAIAAARREILKTIQDKKPVSLKLFNNADILGATEKSLNSINNEIFQLPQASQSEIVEVIKVVSKFAIVDRIANGRRIPFTDLVSIGLLSSSSENRTTLLAALRGLPAEKVDTYQEIQAVLDSAAKKINERKTRLAKVKSRTGQEANI